MRRVGMVLRAGGSVAALFRARSRKSIPKWIFRGDRILRAAIFAPPATLALTHPAQAEPVSTFLIGLAYGLGSGGVVAGGFLGALGAGFSVGAFLATPIGGLLLAAGLQLLGSFVAGAFNGNQQQTPQDSSRVNVRIESATRWIAAGVTVRQGGAVIFGEYDDTGAFWYVLAVADSELVSTTALMFDDVQLGVDVDNFVITNEFCLNEEKAIYTGTGNRVPYYQVWRVTFTPTNPVPPMPADFLAKFPSWTSAHKMAGVSMLVVRIAAIDIENRHKLFRWRGPFGLGEPSASIIGGFSRVYDPRNPAHSIDNPASWTATSNPALIWAWFRTHPQGFKAPMTGINWERIADEADKCDVLITDRYGDVAPRYECNIAIPDNKQRSVAESEILATCDGALFFDEIGRAYIEVGAWREPAIGFTKARDIMAMSSREAADGESETDGVVVTYIEPAFGYIRQPASAWVNPNYFQLGVEPNYMQVEILGCQNHRQAVTLAKAIGQRSQAMQRLAPVVGLRGLLARRERIVSIDYDEEFSGNYEIVAPVELDEAGFSSALSLVPVDQYRWTLLPGEEGARPTATVDAGGGNDLAYPSNLGVYAAFVPGTSGSIVRLEAVFDPPARVDNFYQFDARKVGDVAWIPFTVVMDELVAYSGIVEIDETYEVRYRTVSTSGVASAFIDPYLLVVAEADPTAPGSVTDVEAFAGMGIVDLTWIAPSSANYFAARIYRHTVDSFGASTLVRTEFGSPSVADMWRDSGLAAGTYYYWIVAINGSGVAATEVATGAVVVT